MLNYCHYKTYIQPQIDYCNIIWGGTSQMNLNKLFCLQKRACKIILDYNVDDVMESMQDLKILTVFDKWAASSDFVSSSIPSWQILTAHAQPFRGARDLAFCLKVPLDSLLVWASSEGSGETARMRRLAWTFAARIGDKYQIRLSRSKLYLKKIKIYVQSIKGWRSPIQ